MDINRDLLTTLAELNDETVTDDDGTIILGGDTFFSGVEEAINFETFKLLNPLPED